jgi:hypothetical protein
LPISLTSQAAPVRQEILNEAFLVRKTVGLLAPFDMAVIPFARLIVVANEGPTRKTIVDWAGQEPRSSASYSCQ